MHSVARLHGRMLCKKRALNRAVDELEYCRISRLWPSAGQGSKGKSDSAWILLEQRRDELRPLAALQKRRRQDSI